MASKYVQKVTIDLSEILEEEGMFIKFREPKTEWMMNSDEDQDKQVENFYNLLPNIMLDHNFTDEDGNKLSTDEVLEVFKDSFTLTLAVMKEYFEAPFFIRLRTTKER